MNRRVRTFTLCGIVAVLAVMTDPAPARAQETEDLPALQEKWADVDARLKAKAAEFEQALNSEERRRLRREFESLVDEGNELVAEIKQLALDKFREGDRDESTLNLLMGILINDAAFERDGAVLEVGQELIEAGIDTKYFASAAEADRLSLAGQEIFQELLIRQQEALADDLPRVKLATSKGEIVVELFENEAPETVGNFISLVDDGFYDGLSFHRVLSGFMAQGGDPNGDGSGGPGYTIYCECYKPDYRRHLTGSLSMAKKPARDTGGSQFFITYARTDHLDGQHTVFGRVVEGMDVANSLQRVNPQLPSQPKPDTIVKAGVLRKRDREYVPKKVQ